MAKVVKPPERNTWSSPSVFLAGSIEMGTAALWQDHVTSALFHVANVIYNPRRDDWDSSWEQSITNPKFYEQVSWELDFIINSNLVFFYFDPNTKSPISLMELGLLIGMSREIIVVCPDGFWRKGNVEIICEKGGYAVYNTIQDGLEAAIEYMKSFI